MLFPPSLHSQSLRKGTKVLASAVGHPKFLSELQGQSRLARHLLMAASCASPSMMDVVARILPAPICTTATSCCLMAPRAASIAGLSTAVQSSPSMLDGASCQPGCLTPHLDFLVLIKQTFSIPGSFVWAALVGTAASTQILSEHFLHMPLVVDDQVLWMDAPLCLGLGESFTLDYPFIKLSRQQHFVVSCLASMPLSLRCPALARGFCSVAIDLGIFEPDVVVYPLGRFVELRRQPRLMPLH
eukprot:6492617-Amphidinium_carterae.2